MASDVTIHVESKRFTHNGAAEAVLNAVDIHVARGTLTALFGPSGCGKSTLLRIIAGLDQDYDGHVLLDGHRILRPSAQVGLVTQADSAYEWCTVSSNIGFGLRFRQEFQARGLLRRALGLTAPNVAGPEIERIAALVGLQKSDLAKYPDQLSGGMKQRMNLGRAIAAGPDVLLLDEPFTALDHDSRESLQELVLRLRDDLGTTIIIVTHDPEEALFLGDQVIVLGAQPATVRTTLPGAALRNNDPSIKYISRFQEQRRELQAWLKTTTHHDSA